ncbi:precorrin-3B C(17)-methyltransferase [Pseudalkalibacillus decolorationis]|uniref:precorrin-3B C(17)-methyltransferase n=1 Tax=Pseudalkalibacillus decolorationis TaxID=163879 RepID=UPI0021483F74|nr:precorrin-3B C(17)-methyltransferase [Pseudalkalibacillus decolorationis]
MNVKGKLLVLGFGPGNHEHTTERCKEAIVESDCIIGYKTYVELIQELITDQKIISTGMSEEVSRAQAAVDLAEQGKKVAVISSGDAGVYGMAGLVYEVLVERGWKEQDGVEVEVIPGISAINSCASLLGAPIMHDACTISLSDHLTPWELIAKRIDAAGQADFVISLYNPKSGKRTRQIVEAQQILLNYRSPNTPVGLVKSAYREREQVVLTTLENMLEHDIGMLTTVIIGNSTTFFYEKRMITPRGYQRKYTLNTLKQRLKPHERLKRENEPWALHGGQEEVTNTASQKVQKEKSATAVQTVQEEVSATVVETDKEESRLTALQTAEDALRRIDERNGISSKNVDTISTANKVESIFELAVSPGVVNKKFTPKQLLILAEVIGEKGTMEYTPHHQILLQIPTSEPGQVTEQLEDAGFLLSPIGDVISVKACDFCDGEKKDSIPYADEIQDRLGGLDVPKELRIGFNGCGMACYGAVQDDIGIVFRKGKFDLFLGAKTVGRTAHSGQPVSEGIEPDKLVDLVESIVKEYKENGHPNERFFKYFKRVKRVKGFQYQDVAPKIKVEPAPCGD